MREALEERSITLAIMIMSANAAGIIGSQYFRSDDAPLYEFGWTLIVAMVSVAFCAAVFANVMYWVLLKGFALRFIQ